MSHSVFICGQALGLLPDPGCSRVLAALIALQPLEVAVVPGTNLRSQDLREEPCGLGSDPGPLWCPPSFPRRRPRTSRGLFRRRDTPQACDSVRGICFALGSDFISWTPSSPSRDVITVLTSQTGFIGVCKAEDQLENRDHKNRLETRTARKISTFLAWLQTQRVTQSHTNPHSAGTRCRASPKVLRGEGSPCGKTLSRGISTRTAASEWQIKSQQRCNSMDGTGEHYAK
ncbi:PREDICTED: uncharacterized protein LOC102760615 [Myotis davidii]|uniref:uncharacterized protein LOC102760615 n=1 Tax=Myotis davidii TaxID=225400 RepID=UPI0003EC2C90|nr:PREDICTED: uncharacterized protein LOC102760615 [Myotis davidii]